MTSSQNMKGAGAGKIDPPTHRKIFKMPSLTVVNTNLVLS